LFAVQSDSTLDLVGTQASCTDVYMARSTVNNSFDALDVGLPSSVGTSMGVRDLDTESHALAADIALCHLLHLLAVKIFHSALKTPLYLSRYPQKKQEKFCGKTKFFS